MKLVSGVDNISIERSSERGYFNFGWLQTWHSFSFARYYDPDKVNFGALRVLNDDIIKAGKGFDFHPHDNMEIITIPIKGSIMHKDSMGHQQMINPDEVQVMSAGSGLFHSEFNASNELDASLLQIWILPKEKNIEPVYDQRKFDHASAVNRWQYLVKPKGNDGLTINQEAYISRVYLTEGDRVSYEMHEGSYGCYLFVLNGSVEIENRMLSGRDSMALTHINEFSIYAHEQACVLNIEVPKV